MRATCPNSESHHHLEGSARCSVMFVCRLIRRTVLGCWSSLLFLYNICIVPQYVSGSTVLVKQGSHLSNTLGPLRPCIAFVYMLDSESRYCWFDSQLCDEMTPGKLFIHVCICLQAVQLGTDQKTVMPCSLSLRRLPSNLRQDHLRMCAFSYTCSLPVA